MKVKMKWGFTKGESATVIKKQICCIPSNPNAITWEEIRIRYDDTKLGESGWLNWDDVEKI